MKLSQRIAVLAGACTLAAGLAAAPVNAENPPTPARPLARLNCKPIVQDGAPAAGCEWSLRVEGPATIELWRGEGEAGEIERVKVFTTADLEVKRHVDATVEPGNRYRYMLLILGPEGNERGRLWLQLMRAHHVGGVHMATAAVDLVDLEKVRRLARTQVDVQTYEIEQYDLILATEYS